MTPAQRAMLLNEIIPVIYPRTRSLSIRSTSRRRASRRHRLLFYPLITTLELLLLALPVTILLLVQASFSNRTFVPPLVAFLVIALCICLSAAGVGVLYVRRRRSRLKRRKRLEREVERWRMLAREKGREVEVLRAVGERLRSRSRGRRKRDDSMSRAGSTSVGTSIEKDEEEDRSVSRGRTGRGAAMKDMEVEEGIPELDGLEIRMTRVVPEVDKTRGNVARAKQAAFARLRAEAVEKPLPSLPRNPRSSPPPPPPHFPAHPPRRASIGWQTRWNNMLSLHFRHQSYELEAISPPGQWSDSQTLTSSPQPLLPGRLQETSLLPPPELILDDMDSPRVQTTVLDRYVVPEQYRQARERQQELEKRQALHRRQEQKRKLRQRRELEAELARHDTSDASGNNPAAGEVRDQHKSEPGWSRVLKTAFDAESSHVEDEEDEEVEIGVAKIVRGGNGGWGDVQSDENFAESHALDDDAVSLTESLRQKKKAESLRKVVSWEDGTRVAAAETEEEAVTADVDVKNSDRTARPQGGESDWRDGLDVGHLWNSMKDENWEIHERRRMFEKFLDTKTRQGASGSRSEPGEMDGPGISGKENVM
ncbi:hypothetical protein MMC18_005051 [Xylographa bjoerkii]|nr:hypothetical protein [Xylographa bjoerkii]